MENKTVNKVAAEQRQQFQDDANWLVECRLSLEVLQNADINVWMYSEHYHGVMQNITLRIGGRREETFDSYKSVAEWLSDFIADLEIM